MFSSINLATWFTKEIAHFTSLRYSLSDHHQLGIKTISSGLLPGSTKVPRNSVPRKRLCLKAITDRAASIVPFYEPTLRRHSRIRIFSVVVAPEDIAR